MLDSPVFRAGVGGLFVGIVGTLTYFPVFIARLIAEETLWPVPAGERWVVRFTIAWLILMAIAVLGMAMYLADSLRATSNAGGARPGRR